MTRVTLLIFCMFASANCGNPRLLKKVNVATQKRPLTHTDCNDCQTKSELKLNHKFPQTIADSFLLSIGAEIVQKPEEYEDIVKRAKEEDMRNRSNCVENDILRRNKRRGFVADKIKLWNYTMLLVLDKKLNEVERIETEAAIFTLYQAMKCFEFRIVPHEPKLLEGDDCVFIEKFNKEGGCFSDIGRMGGRQVVGVGEGCNPRYGITMHEMMHTLGFYHEHTRIDRDKYIRIHWENIDPEIVGDFEIEENQLEIDEYDFESIQHYRLTTKPVNGVTVISPLNPGDIEGIDVGQKHKLSRLDLKRLKTLYPCDVIGE